MQMASLNLPCRLVLVIPACIALGSPSRAAAEEPMKTPAAPGAPDASAAPEPLAGTAESSDFGAELRGYMGFGGEEIAEVEYSDGSSSDLSLGTYFFIGLGGIYSPWRSGNSGIDLELLAGWATWSTGPDNTDDRVKLSRVPLEALAYYRHTLSSAEGSQTLLRVGGGVSWHLIGGVTGSGSLEGLELDLDNALGGVVEVAVVYTILAAGIRYMPMSYRVSDSGRVLDADSLGLFFSLHVEPGLL